MPIPSASPSATQPPAPTPPQIVVPQAPAARRGCRSGCFVIGVIGLVVVAAGVFLGWRFVNEEVLPGIQETADQFSTVSETPPGPCYDLDTEDGLLTGWTEVSCSGPRQVEVTFAATFDEGPYPGDLYLTDAATDTCPAAFERYVGVSIEASAYDVDWLLPTAAMWANGARQGICLVVTKDGSALAGTVKGSAT